MILLFMSHFSNMLRFAVQHLAVFTRFYHSNLQFG